MSRYEFQVVPAPVKARKLTDLTKDQDVYCATITDILTDMGLAGWDFVGAETLPHYQPRMMFFSRYSEKTCLVFRREIERLTEPPRRAKRTRAGAATDKTPRPVLNDHSEVVVRKDHGARRLNISVPDQVPPRPEPLVLENPMGHDTVVPIKLQRSEEARAALNALERAVAIQPDR